MQWHTLLENTVSSLTLLHFLFWWSCPDFTVFLTTIAAEKIDKIERGSPMTSITSSWRSKLHVLGVRHQTGLKSCAWRILDPIWVFWWTLAGWQACSFASSCREAGDSTSMRYHSPHHAMGWGHTDHTGARLVQLQFTHELSNASIFEHGVLTSGWE